MYYCNCEGASPLSALGIAVADNVEGPYQDLGIILKSGQDAATPDEPCAARFDDRWVVDSDLREGMLHQLCPGEVNAPEVLRQGAFRFINKT